MNESALLSFLNSPLFRSVTKTQCPLFGFWKRLYINIWVITSTCNCI